MKIDTSIRLTNYLIDLVIIVIMWIIASVLMQDLNSSMIAYYVITFLYYFIFELSMKQTIGKLVTKTFVVKKNGVNPSFVNILIRSCCRLIPIDSFSYLFGTERGLHDVLSSTRLAFKNK